MSFWAQLATESFGGARAESLEYIKGERQIENMRAKLQINCKMFP